MLEKWVGVLEDPWNDFRLIDRDGSGSITFDEFADWAIYKNLDLDKNQVSNEPKDLESDSHDDY